MLRAHVCVLPSLRAYLQPLETQGVSDVFLRGKTTVSTTSATGVNYFKKGDDPLLKEDSEYPEWLWDIAEPPATLFNLQRQMGSSEINDDNISEVRRLVKLENIRDIKDRNFIKAKK